jgi:hypothetical protein
VAIFGRNTARQRLRRAARESIATPVFKSAPVDCGPWVTGGLWPAELSTITTQTAPLVTHLQADLQRIVDDANNELTRLQLAGLPEPIRSAHEARIINAARGFAVRRVESTVRSVRSTNTRPANRQQVPSSGHIDATPQPRFIITPADPAATADAETATAPTATGRERPR